MIPVLVGLLVIAAFFIGSLYTKVQYLEKTAATQAAAGPAAGQPVPSGPPAKVTVSLGHLPLKGNKDAKVKIVEFADFRCPFCERYFTETEPQIIKDYVDSGKVAIAFRHWAFLGPASTVAANAAECANDQGKFWEFHDYLYKNQPPETDISMYNTDTLTQAAVKLGLNGDSFRSCLNGKKDDGKIQTDYTDGQKAGVSGTPAFFINGTPLVGAQPFSAFKAAIDAELTK